VIAHTMDDVLFDWLFQNEYTVPATTPVDHVCLKPFYDAAKWISCQIFELKASKEEVAEKLWRVVTVDQNMRNPLFYVSSDLVPSICKEGTKYISSRTPDLVNTKSKFVNSVTPNGVSALMSAAALGDKDKVQMLINEGASRSVHTSDEGWNVLHFVISKPEDNKSQQSYHLRRSVSTSTTDDEEKWMSTLDMVEILLRDADNSELDEMFLSPQAEHTPLMLAVSKGADEKTTSFFIEKTALRAVNSLVRRDKEMNSVLHLAVKGILNKGKFSLGPIKALLSQSTVISGVENTRGLTASDISLESVLSIWGDKRSSQFAQASRELCNLESTELKPPRSNEIDYGETVNRRDLFDCLIRAETEKRITVGFGDVKTDSNNASKSAQKQPQSPEETPLIGKKATSSHDCILPRL